MPNRRIHLTSALRFIEAYNLNAKFEDVSIIETLIDHPGKLPALLRYSIYRKCGGNPLLEAARSGFRIRGVMSHDWRSRAGRRTLEDIVECLFGADAVLLVQLHLALDDIWEGKIPRDYDDRVILFVSSFYRVLVDDEIGNTFS